MARCLTLSLSRPASPCSPSHQPTSCPSTFLALLPGPLHTLFPGPETLPLLQPTFGHIGLANPILSLCLGPEATCAGGCQDLVGQPGRWTLRPRTLFLSRQQMPVSLPGKATLGPRSVTRVWGQALTRVTTGWACLATPCLSGGLSDTLILSLWGACSLLPKEARRRSHPGDRFRRGRLEDKAMNGLYL